MSDSEDSTVTYTAVSSPFGGLSDIGSPGVDGPPVMPEDPYAYVVAAFQAPPSPDYVLGPEHPPSPEFVPEPPLSAAVSPTAESPGYIADSDPEEDPEEDPADYPTDGGDDDDDDDVEEGEDEDEEEEEHPAPSDSVLPPIVRLLAIPSPLPSPLSPLSSPLPQIPSPPLPISSPVPVSSQSPHASPTYPLGYRAAMIRLRAETPSTSHPLPSSTPPLGTPPLLPIPLPTSSPPLLLPSTIYRAGVSESSSAPTARPTRGFRVDYGFVSTLDDEIRRDPERYVGYGITDTWDEMLVDMLGAPTTDETESLMSGLLNMMYRDRRTHDRTARLMETKARLSREAWVRSMDASDLACSEVMALRTQVVAQQSEIVTALQSQLGPASGPAQIEGIIFSCDSKKMAPKRTTIANAAATSTTTTTVSNAQLNAMIDQGATDALAAHDAGRNTNGDDSHNSGTDVRRMERVARECTYLDFMKCEPLNLKGTTVGHDVAYEMTWTDMKNKMTNKYCPRGEIKKLEVELWNLKVKESDKIKRYVGGLPDMIHGSVVAPKPKTMQEAIEIANELIDNKIRTFAECQTENKRKQDDNQQQQQQNKRQNTGRAYTAGSGEKKPYGESKPLCPKCNYHHDGPCAPKCHKCNRVSHLARDCRSPANANASNNQRGTRAGQKPTCYECGA
ncbi:putative reverse transcriptase domain-containing protein [Tanacetum coccineum]